MHNLVVVKHIFLKNFQKLAYKLAWKFDLTIFTALLGI